jgi:hypothetical protein
VAHACNSSYSGDRDQEGHSLKPDLANSSQDPISKNPSQKTGLVEWLLSYYQAGSIYSMDTGTKGWFMIRGRKT